MKMEQTVFQNVGIYNSDNRELPRRKHTTFRTRRRFKIKNNLELDPWLVPYLLKYKMKIFLYHVNNWKVTLQCCMKLRKFYTGHFLKTEDCKGYHFIFA